MIRASVFLIWIRLSSAVASWVRSLAAGFAPRAASRTSAFALAFALLCGGNGAAAATLTWSGGQLLGASGIDVGGTFYDVQFVDGTCIALFSGCDETSDFTFQTLAETREAGAALSGQVYEAAHIERGYTGDPADGIDWEPSLTSGCFFSLRCIVYTPFEYDGDVTTPYDQVMTLPAWSWKWENDANPGLLLRRPRALPNSLDTGAMQELFDSCDCQYPYKQVYADWTLSPAPEPGTATLLGIGLVGMSVLGRRRRQHPSSSFGAVHGRQP